MLKSSLCKKEAVKIKKRIDDTKLFYRVDFPSHVQSKTEYSCCCFELGFHDSEGMKCGVCPTIDEHKNPCNKCSDMYAVVELLQEKHNIDNAQPNLSSAKHEDLGQLWQDISDTKSDLDEYQSHLAWQVLKTNTTKKK